MSNLNIFDASQRGDLERLKYLIAVEGIDMTSKNEWVKIKFIIDSELTFYIILGRYSFNICFFLWIFRYC